MRQSESAFERKLRVRLPNLTKPCEMITFNNGSEPVKTKSGGGILGKGYSRVGAVLGGDFDLRGLTIFLK